MPLGEYVTGALFYIPTSAAALLGAYLVLSERYAYLLLLQRCLAFLVLATAAILFTVVAPAALGVLTRTTALVASLVLLVGCLAVPRTGQGWPAVAMRAPPSGRLSIAIAAVTVAAVAIYELARLRLLATQPITEIDMLSFHLPGVARFIQTGTLWRVDQFLPGFATAQYPNNGDFLILSAVLPWHDLAFVRFVPVPYFAFTGIGAYAVALELGAPRAAAATIGAALLTVPALSLLALDGLPDAISLATFAAGLVFLLRYSREPRRDELLLAGLAFGLSLGTKWYGATSAGIVLVVWAAGRLLARRGLRQVAREAGQLLAVMLASGGIWLVRNLVESGNPIYPKAVSSFGVQLFAGSRGDIIDRFGYTVADYLGNPHILRAFIYPAFKSEVGLLGLVLVIGLVIGLVAAVRTQRGTRGRDPVSAWVTGLIIVVVAVCLDYAITPGSGYGPKNLPVQTFANVRWLMPAILIAAAVAAQAVNVLGRLGPLLELGALAGAFDGMRLGPSVPASTAWKVGVIAATITAVAVVAARRAANRERRRARRAAVVVLWGGAVALGLAGLGRLDEHSFDRHTYASYDGTLAWIERHAAIHHRVGVTGTWTTTGVAPTLPAFGPRLGNWVAYIGDPVVHSLHLPASERTFDAEVRRGRYDLLLIGLTITDKTNVWAWRLGYRLVALSPRLALLRATRPLSEQLAVEPHVRVRAVVG